MYASSTASPHSTAKSAFAPQIAPPAGAASAYARSMSHSPAGSDAGTTSARILHNVKSMPMMLTGVSFVYFLLAPIVAMISAPFGEDTGQFLIKQITLNSCLLILLAMVYGLGTIVYPTGLLKRYQNILLPMVLVGLLWIKCFFTYQQGLSTHCTALAKQSTGAYATGTSPFNANSVLWNSAKVPIAIVVTYFFVILFPQAFVPFFQFFCGDEEPHPLVIYFAIGFWTGCAAWASEASCYFQMVRTGCRPFDNIQFEKIATIIDSSENSLGTTAT